MRLIDADKLKKQFDLKSTNPNYRVDNHNIWSIIKNATTVDAIPKTDYENRLKADMVAMLKELKEQLREMHEDFFETEHFDEAYGVSDSMDIIQEKINALKEAADDQSGAG